MPPDDRVAHQVAEADQQRAEDQQHDRHAVVAGQQQGEDQHRGGHHGELRQEQPEREQLQTVRGGPAPAAHLLEDRDAQDGEAQQQSEVVVVGVRAHLGQEAAADVLEALGERRHGLPLQQDLGAAAEQQHPRQGDDERRDPQVGDPEALPGARECPDGQRAQHRRGPRDVVLDHHHRGGRSDEGGQRADREVDVPGDDDDHHADRQDEDVAVLLDQVGDVEWLEQDAVGPDLEQQHDQREGDQHAVLAYVAAQRPGQCAAE